MQQSKQQQIKIDLKQTTGVVCEDCKGEVFIEGLVLRKASRFLTGESQDSLIPIPTFVCASCGTVPLEFLPQALREAIETNLETESDVQTKDTSW